MSATVPPYQPNGRQLLRFWLAPVLTCLFFAPMLLAGLFGAPSMLVGTFVGWLQLRSGEDDFGKFALSGLFVAIFTLVTVAAIAPDASGIFLFGLLFGPLMAMTFRLITGRWRD